MKRVLVIFFILLFINGSVFSSTEERKTVGLVLSGGGAKGVAHIGALKVIREAGIPIDYIAGTSMGAIVGGLTALGYTPYALDSIVRGLNWSELFSDKVARDRMSYSQKLIADRYILSIALNKEKRIDLQGLTSGQNVINLLQRLSIGYNDSISFNDLPTPFACVAYDMVNGEAVVLDHGDLSMAIRSSMSIPGVFIPVRLDSLVLVDGGILNNFPVDVVKSMGADIVIGVDVGSGVMTASELDNPGSLVNQLTTFYGYERNQENIKATDLYIHPDVHPYTAASFSSSAIDSLIMRGECAARASWDELIELKERIGIEESYAPDYYDKHPDFNKPILLGEIEFIGLEYLKRSDAIKISDLKERSELSEVVLLAGIRNLQGSGLFSQVTYILTDENPYKLTITVEERSRNSLNLGLRFDTKEMASVLLNATIATKGTHFSEFNLTTRLNENPYLKVTYKIGTPIQRKSALSYMLKYTSVNLYKEGHKVSNIDYLKNEVDISFSNIRFRRMKIALGVKFEYFDFDAIYTDSDDNILKPKSEGLTSLYLDSHYDSYDEFYYPTRGVSVRLNYMATTSSLNMDDNFAPFGALSYKFETAISASSRVTFLPSIYGRVINGDNISFPYQNFIGGAVGARYFNSHMPFIGIHQLEAVENAVLVGQFETRVRLWQKHYVSLKGNYANYRSKLFDFESSTSLWGGGIGYSYSTVLGPVELLMDMSSKYRSPGVYVSFGYYF